MGTDDLFHKRKAKKARDLCRRKAKRAPYAKILIVCEGEKTEPHYFNGVKDHYGLNSANIEICGECGSDPLRIFQHAKQRYREERDALDPFDKVFCVFDKDTHPQYRESLQAIAVQKPHNTFVAITSVPCFEYWLLLHFTYTTRPYSPLPGNSVGNQVLADLCQYMPDYQKGQKAVFAELIDQLDFAIKNAQRALQTAERSGTDNPTTHVHELVDFMRKIKEKERY